MEVLTFVGAVGVKNSRHEPSVVPLCFRIEAR
jgi:hypothetical protein